MPEFRSLRTAAGGALERLATIATIATLSLTTVGLIAALALAPGASAATARPACTRHALWHGLSRGTEQVHHARIVRPFGCDGAWAYAAVDTSRFELTSLFHARGGEWVTVGRGGPCARGEVPRRIRRAACRSN